MSGTGQVFSAAAGQKHPVGVRVSWRRRFVSSGLVHYLKIKPAPEFWVDWGKTRAMDLLKADQPKRAAVQLARLEARARHEIEGYAGRIAALTASFGQDDLGGGDVHCSAYVNDADVPEEKRASCEARLYGTIEPNR